MKEMKLKITRKGEVKIEGIKGTVGAECLELTKKLEQAIGQTESRELTEDYYKEKENEYEYNKNA